ncbi:MAG TPA: DNA translocase FtsK 4TM domain-containing protein, partial [bacterium]|nr:DNA translocase FtsK 4TM domain-containing protein [bacterium]
MESKDIERWVKAVALFLFGIFIFLCLWTYSPYDLTFGFCQLGYPPQKPANFGGPFGARISGLLVFLLGSSAYLFVFLLIVLGWSSLWGDLRSWKREVASLAGLLLVSATLFSLGGNGGLSGKGGLIGLLMSYHLTRWFGSKGVYPVLGLVALGLVGLGHRVLITPFVELISQACQWRRTRLVLPPVAQVVRRSNQEDLSARPEPSVPVPTTPVVVTGAESTPSGGTVPEKPERKPVIRTVKTTRTASGFKLPPLDLLKIG